MSGRYRPLSETWPVLAVALLVQIAKQFLDAHRHVGREVPQQLVKLVQQAHSGQPADMAWDIEVSPEMNRALCAPLTQEQLQTMADAEPGVFSRSVFCYLVSSRFKRGELSGVVSSSVTVHSSLSRNDLTCPRIKLRIVVSEKVGGYPNHRWEVTSVEQIG